MEPSQIIPYTRLPVPVRITEHYWPENVNPLISIHCLTFNHVKFIRQAIDGFLMQETTFPVEILIHDDASTDGTQDVIKEYEKQYPRLIKPIYQTENQYSKGNRPSLINLNRAFGEFIAWCEGDDYWTASHKLQKQIEVLESDPSLSACVHRVKVVVETIEWIEKTGAREEEILPELPLQDQFGVLEAIDPHRMHALTASIVLRRVDLPRPEWVAHCYMGDRILFSSLASRGPIAVLPATMSVYRRHNSGFSAKFNLSDTRFSALRARLVFYKNIGDIVGRAPEIEKKRIELLRHFSRQYVASCLNTTGLGMRKRVALLKDGLIGWGYFTTLLTRQGGLRETFRMLQIILGGIRVRYRHLINSKQASLK